jgi:hypothetical protein
MALIIRLLLGIMLHKLEHWNSWCTDFAVGDLGSLTMSETTKPLVEGALLLI